MINLCLVVIATQFSETKQREHQLMQEQRARYLSSSTVASYMEPGDCYEEIFQYICHIMRKAKRRTLGLYNSIQSRRQGHVQPSNAKLGMNRKSQRHYSKDCMCKAGNTSSGNVSVTGSISVCQLAKGPVPTKHRIRINIGHSEHGAMASALRLARWG